MESSFHYSVSQSITDLGEDVVQYIEFNDQLFLRQVDEIISDCPYTGFNRIGTLINTEMDYSIRVIGFPKGYPSLLDNLIHKDYFDRKWKDSCKWENVYRYQSQKIGAEAEMAELEKRRSSI